MRSVKVKSVGRYQGQNQFQVKIQNARQTDGYNACYLELVVTREKSWFTYHDFSRVTASINNNNEKDYVIHLRPQSRSTQANDVRKYMYFV